HPAPRQAARQQDRSIVEPLTAPLLRTSGFRPPLLSSRRLYQMQSVWVLGAINSLATSAGSCRSVPGDTAVRGCGVVPEASSPSFQGLGALAVAVGAQCLFVRFSQKFIEHAITYVCGSLRRFVPQLARDLRPGVSAMQHIHES